MRKEQEKTFREMLLDSSEYNTLNILIVSVERFTKGWIPNEQHILDLLINKTLSEYLTKRH